MSIGLRSLLPPASLSVRSLGTCTGVPDSSVRRQASRVLIDRQHTKLGGLTGPIGLPFGELHDAPASAGYFKRYSGGRVQVMDFNTGPQGFEEFRAYVRFVGYRVNDTNDASADEPYFIIGVTGANPDANLSMRTEIEGSVKSGNNVVMNRTVTQTAQPPFTLSVVGMDHDAGDPDEAAGKVEQSLKDAAAKITLALPLVGIPSAVGAYATTFLTIFGDWIGGGISALFGMGDDRVGSNSKYLFEYDAGNDRWKQPPPQTDPDFPEPHNLALILNNGGNGGGSYTAYFDIQLHQVADKPVP